VNDWLEDFSFAGIKLTEGEKSLMRFAMSKERERIIKIIKAYEKDVPLPESFDNIIGIDEVIDLIKGEQK
jgi:hypothetical protein